MEREGRARLVEIVQMIIEACDGVVTEQPLRRVGMQWILQLRRARTLADRLAKFLLQHAWLERAEFVDVVVQRFKFILQTRIQRGRYLVIDQRRIGTPPRQRGFTEIIGNPKINGDSREQGTAYNGQKRKHQQCEDQGDPAIRFHAVPRRCAVKYVIERS